jgi:hypothetical protein
VIYLQKCLKVSLVYFNMEPTATSIFGKGLFPVGLSHLGSEEDKEDNNEAKHLGSPIRLHDYILVIFAALHHNSMRIGFASIVR